MTLTLEGTDVEILFQQEQDSEKVCSWKHAQPVEAQTEVVCLGCAAFCGYACAEHTDYGIKIINHRIAGKLMCRKCGTFNLFSFIPLGA